MITLRPSNERGLANLGWLHSRHTFSFARYYDPGHMGFRNLRVINEDRVAGGGGFPTHAHDNMEILTYVLSGALAHQDSIAARSGNNSGERIEPGDVQKMSAGTGLSHSEGNASKSEPVHFLQIWIEPSKRAIEPSYQQAHFGDEDKLNRLLPIAAPPLSVESSDKTLPLQAEAILFASVLEPGHSLSHMLGEERGAWLQVISGQIEVNGIELKEGDGAAIEGERELSISAQQKSHFLLFDLGE